MERDEKPAAMMQMEGSSSSASNRIRSPSNPPDAGRTGSSPTAPAADETAMSGHARMMKPAMPGRGGVLLPSSFTKSQKGCMKGGPTRSCMRRDGFAFDPKEEPRGGHGEEQAGKDEQAGEGGE